MVSNRLSLLATILLIVPALLLAGCTPPTPPPSPTPWASATPVAAGTTAPPSPTAIPTVTATATPTPPPTNTPAPLLPTATPDKVAITVWENLPPGQSSQLAADVEAFQAQFPRFQVTLRQYDSPESFMTPLMAGQQSFDVVLASPGLLNSLHAAGQIAPMADFFPPSFLDGFSAVPLSGAAADDQTWGLPQTAGFHLMLYYNKALVDTPPATTSELLEMGQASAGEDGPPTLGLNALDPLWLVPWLAANGGWLADDSGTPALDSPAMVAALQLHQGWLSSIAPALTYQEMMEQFSSGKLAMMINGDWATGELAASRDVDWGVALLPGLNQGDDVTPAAPLVLAKYWAISQTATQERALASATFLEFITQPERQLAWAAKFGLLPTRRPALDDPLITTDAIRRISAAQMRAGQTLPLGINPNQLLDAMRDPLAQLLAGSLTPEQAAKQMQQNLAQ
ncbi:MAG: hypothetical protein Kow0031_19160 [Anaerolineae bacterium]